MVTKEDINTALDKVIDPHTNISIFKMGLIKEVEINTDENAVTIHFQPTTPFCPMVGMLTDRIKEEVTKVAPNHELRVEVIL